MNYWPYLIVLVLFGAFVVFSQRARKRQLAQALVRSSRIGVGSEVMTTSGLYGTVVARREDGTVTLAVAPGVELRWAVAALREADSLAEPYRRGIDGPNASAADVTAADPNVGDASAADPSAGDQVAHADAEDPTGADGAGGKSAS